MEQWTGKWPETPGWYWFYGCEFGTVDSKITLTPVQVRGPIKNSQGGKSYMYTAGSHFLDSSEAIGLWMPIEVPELPTLDN